MHNLSPHVQRSNNAQLRRRNIQRVHVGRQSRIRLLAPIRPNQSVHLNRINVVHFLQRILDLPLVGLDVDDEDERVVLFDLLHCGFGVEGVEEDVGGVEAGFMLFRCYFLVGSAIGLAETYVYALPWVLWASRKDKSLWPVEGCAVADFSHFVGVGAFQGGLCSLVGFASLAAGLLRSF